MAEKKAGGAVDKLGALDEDDAFEEFETGVCVCVSPFFSLLSLLAWRVKALRERAGGGVWGALCSRECRVEQGAG